MLTISEIKIGHTVKEWILDTRPNIRFALTSDIPGEKLKTAEISAGGWKTETDDQLNIVYGGEMKPFTTYTVNIHATGTSGEEAWGEAAFTTGRLDTPWEGKWITDNTYSFPEKLSPVPLAFQKTFCCKQITRAWINSTALGIYELELNGQKVGRDYFAPGLTSYAHQIQYQTYDITHLLAGENTLCATVAGGWAAGSFTYHRKSHISCDRQAFLCEIHLCYADGSREVIATDESWQVTTDSPFRVAEWYDGEVYDGTFDPESARWKPADITRPRGEPRLLAQYGEPVRVQQTLYSVDSFRGPNGEMIYDFGQNFSGVLSVTVKNASRGQTIVLRHSEVLSNGELFVKSLRTAKATAEYICRKGEQTYSPRFTYMGFRYVDMVGAEPEDITLCAYVLHSDFEQVGEFSCSNPLLNRLNENIRWGGRSNFVDIPTDCPQRDERMGWTGDIAVFASTACFHYDMSRFFDKWLLDMASEQRPSGAIPVVIPRQGDTMPPMVTSCWGDSCILVPWAEYLARGDRELLRRQYPVMKKFLKGVKKWAGLFSFTKNSRYIWQFPFHYGDWCAPGENIKDWVGKGKWVATAYFANSCGIVARIAEILGEEADASFYRKEKERIVNAYRAVFTDGKGNLKREFQTGYVLPLHFGMTQGEETGAMVENLVRLLEKNDHRLATGFPSTPYLLFALSDNGCPEEAYRVLLQEQCPGWLYTVKAGGTTIWERWDALRPDGSVNTQDLQSGEDNGNGGMVSFNHYAYGAVGDWLYRRVAGIEPLKGGYKVFRVAPVPGGGLTHAKAAVQTPYGTAASEWEMNGDEFTISVQVPVSTVCYLTLPDSQEKILESGHHVFTLKL